MSSKDGLIKELDITEYNLCKFFCNYFFRNKVDFLAKVLERTMGNLKNKSYFTWVEKKTQSNITLTLSNLRNELYSPFVTDFSNLQ